MLNINKLPPPFSATRNQHNIIANHGPASTPALLHTAYVRIGRAFCCLLLLVFIASCSKEDEVHFVEISEYYAESCHLDQATQDSIVRFSQKVDAFVIAHPLAKEDPLYARILHNIQTSTFDPTFKLNTDWEGEIQKGF